MRYFILCCLFACVAPVHAMLIFKPQKFDAKTAKLIVVIHGCLQSSESMAMGTGWDQIAEENNLIVFYPQVDRETHPLDCWSWYQPTNQIKESGQLASLHAQIGEVKKLMGIPKAPVFLAGMSSGGTMVAGLLACFPEDYKFGAIHSAPLYGSAKSLKDGERILRDGPPPAIVWRPCTPAKFDGRLFVIHGNNDKSVALGSGRAQIRDFFPDLAPPPTERINENGIKYLRSNYRENGQLLARYIEVEDLGHAWSGFNQNFRHPKVLTGDIVLPFFHAGGPSATNMMWEFFKEPIRQPRVRKATSPKDFEGK